MVALAGALATINGEPRQARKGATVIIDSCAGMLLVRVATFLFSFCGFIMIGRNNTQSLCIIAAMQKDSSQ